MWIVVNIDALEDLILSVSKGLKNLAERLVFDSTECQKQLFEALIGTETISERNCNCFAPFLTFGFGWVIVFSGGPVVLRCCQQILFGARISFGFIVEARVEFQDLDG